MSQPRHWSALEALTNVTVGYLLAVATQYAVFPLFDLHVSLNDNLAIAMIFTIVSIIRSYTLRRIFNSVRHP